MAKRTRNGEPERDKRGLQQDPLVDRLRHDPSQPPAVEYQGFLGHSEKEGYWRLYLTRALDDYLEIADSDIVDRKPRSDRDPEAGSCIWIKATAIITRGPVYRVPVQALACAPLPPLHPRCLSADFVLAGRLAMVPLLPWAMAAHCWSAFFGALERDFLGAGRAAQLSSHDIRCGNIINLPRCDYKIL
jgi:hypothetical protein